MSSKSRARMRKRMRKIKSQTFEVRYNLGKPRKRIILSEEDGLFLQAEFKRNEHSQEMSELEIKTCETRFG